MAGAEPPPDLRPGAPDSAPTTHPADTTDQTPPEKETSGQAPESGAPAAPEGQTGRQKATSREEKSPWRLVDQYKGRVKSLETEIAQLRERAMPQEQWQATQERLQKAESRVKEFEDDLRYRNYQQTEEFKAKYQQPYEKAWHKAMSDLDDVQIQDENGTRKFSPEDMRTLCSMNPIDARKLATQWFGESAEDVLAQRRKITDLWDAQQEALEDARKNGAEREKKQNEERQVKSTEVQKHMRTTFESAQKEILEHPKVGKWFKPDEADPDSAKALEQGMAFAQKAFSTIAEFTQKAHLMPPDARAEVVRMHAALIARAGAFSRIARAYSRLEGELNKAREELKAFQSSVPGNGRPSNPNTRTEPPKTAKEEVFQALRNLPRH